MWSHGLLLVLFPGGKNSSDLGYSPAVTSTLRVWIQPHHSPSWASFTSVEGGYCGMRIKWGSECVSVCKASGMQIPFLPPLLVPGYSTCPLPLSTRAPGKAIFLLPFTHLLLWPTAPIGFLEVSPAPLSNVQTHQYWWPGCYIISVSLFCLLCWGCIRTGLQVEPFSQDKAEEEHQRTSFHPFYRSLITTVCRRS